MRLDAPRFTQRAADWIARHDRLARVMAILAVVIVTALILVFYRYLPAADAAGYVGIFVLNFVSSATVFIPVPGILAKFFGGAYLNPWYVGVVSGLGMALGEILTYMLGFSGHRFAERSRWYPTVAGWLRRRGGVVIVVFATVPNPIFDAIGIAAGGLRYPFWRYVVLVTIGTILNGLLLAHAGALSLPFVLDVYERLFGVSTETG
ncbi:MAG: VTT domain-containing protein [Dehalococcoidia bacterium]